METKTNSVLTLTIYKMATPHMAKIKEEPTTIRIAVTTYHPTIKETINLDLNKVKLETTTTLIIDWAKSHQVVKMESITNLAQTLTIFKMAILHMAKIKEAQTTYHPTIKETINLVLNKVKLVTTIPTID